MWFWIQAVFHRKIRSEPNLEMYNGQFFVPEQFNLDFSVYFLGKFIQILFLDKAKWIWHRSLPSTKENKIFSFRALFRDE